MHFKLYFTNFTYYWMREFTICTSLKLEKNNDGKTFIPSLQVPPPSNARCTSFTSFSKRPWVFKTFSRIPQTLPTVQRSWLDTFCLVPWTFTTRKAHTTKTAKYCMFSAHKLYFRMTTDVYDGNSVKSRVFILKSKKYLRCLTQNIQSYSSDSPSCHRMCCWSCVFAFDRVPNYVICNLIRIYLFFCFTPWVDLTQISLLKYFPNTWLKSFNHIAQTHRHAMRAAPITFLHFVKICSSNFVSHCCLIQFCFIKKACAPYNYRSTPP